MCSVSAKVSTLSNDAILELLREVHEMSEGLAPSLIKKSNQLSDLFEAASLGYSDWATQFSSIQLILDAEALCRTRDGVMKNERLFSRDEIIGFSKFVTSNFYWTGEAHLTPYEDQKHKPITIEALFDCWCSENLQ